MTDGFCFINEFTCAYEFKETLQEKSHTHQNTYHFQIARTEYSMWQELYGTWNGSFEVTCHLGPFDEVWYRLHFCIFSRKSADLAVYSTSDCLQIYSSLGRTIIAIVEWTMRSIL